MLWIYPAGDGNTKHLDEAVDLPGDIELQDGVFAVGREEPADVVIPVPTVSGRHALLRISELCITLHHCDKVPPLFMSHASA